MKPMRDMHDDKITEKIWLRFVKVCVLLFVTGLISFLKGNI